MTVDRFRGPGVVGFRCWRIVMSTGGSILLVPYVARAAWTVGGPTVAVCAVGGDRHLPPVVPHVSIAWAPDHSEATVTAVCGDMVVAERVEVGHEATPWGRGRRAMDRDALIVAKAARDLGRRVRAEYRATYALRVPSAECTCGLHAYTTVEAAMSLHGGNGIALGGVLGWGRIVVHGTQGWRAQYAQPIALALVIGVDGEVVQMAASTYGIPVVPFNMLESYALEFGERLPEERR